MKDGKRRKELTMKRCPRCSQVLEEIAFWGVKVDGCRGCGGVWFDQGELTRLTRSQKADLRALESEFKPAHVTETAPAAAMRCPVCAEALFGFEFKHSPGLKFDGCRKCQGIWVDDGELAAIQQRLTAGPSSPAAEVTTPPEPVPDQRARQAMGFLLRVTCPACAEPNPSTSLTCWACGGPLQGPRPVLWSEMDCPACGHRLRPFAFGGVRLDACARCGGIWFDDDELRRMREERPQALERIEGQFRAAEPGLTPAPEASRTRRCPVCGDPLTEYTYAYTSAIKLDRCDQCHGLWVDEGELAAMQQQLQADATARGEDLRRFGGIMRQVEAVGELEDRQQQFEAHCQAITQTMQTMHMSVSPAV
jgi:Zn-finger nucleic acid-binding protein